MIRSYFVIALRNLRKHFGYAALNVTGLALGIACCLLMILYVQDELSYDRFHINADRIVRVVLAASDEGGQRIARTSALLGPALEDAFPAVEHAVRLDPETGVVKIGNRRFHEDLIFADAAFFDVFSFPLTDGDPSSALLDPSSVVLSEAAAQKFFGDVNPLGRTMSIRLGESFHDFTVTGIAAPIPSASSIRFDVLLPFERLAYFNEASIHASWATLANSTYVLLEDAKDIDDVTALLPEFVKANVPSQLAGRQTYELQRTTDIHFEPDVLYGLAATANPAYVYLLCALAIFVLILACINFTTLSLGRSVSRVREVGIRKVVGAVRSQLMKQFWGEALIVSLVGLLLGLLLLEAVLPRFNELVGKQLQVAHDPIWMLSLASILMIVSLLAGSYPAIYLSRFNPVKILKGDAAGAGKHRLTTALVVAQFAVSIFLVISTLFVSEQLDLLMEKNLGYDREQVVRIRAEYGSTWEGRHLFDEYRSVLASEPSVKSLTGSMYAFAGPDGMQNRFGLIAGQDTVPGYTLNVTPTFLETFGIELLEGRKFSEDRPADAQGSVLVNKTLVDAFGWDEPLGKTLTSFQFADATVIGVAEDFHYESLHQPIQPMALFIGDAPLWHIYARIDSENLPAAVDALQRAWRTVAPDLPFEFEFLDQAVDRMYRSEAQWASLIRTAAAVAIFIACLGLLGLAALAAARRKKEISIRQVLGASIERIIVLLTGSFVVWVFVAFIVATPLAYFAVRRWLEKYAYQVEIDAGNFVAAGMIALGIAILTVSTQALRAALTDPAEGIRSDG